MLSACFVVLSLVGNWNGSQNFFHAFGTSYEIEIRKPDMLNAPAWDPDQENPPISARKAIQIGHVQRRKYVDEPDGWRWEFESALLRETLPGRWYWDVRFQAKPLSGVYMGITHEFHAYILMDGRVVEPKMTKPTPPN